MNKNIELLNSALNDTETLGIQLFNNSSKTPEAALAIATAFIMQARKIYRTLGGARLSAAQFYGIADEEAKDTI